ncbi:MAG: hypothetical protein JRI80_12740 [Deltaproteobacteria bacterium]|nr:hypothetical protein [Deltaproteobacteria bacterium]
MDEYSSLAGTSIITPPHGKVSGLTGKRKIGERRKQKKNGKEKRKKGEEDFIIHGRIQESMEKKDNETEGHLVVKDGEPKEEEAVIEYGKLLPGKKRKGKIDLMI